MQKLFTKRSTIIRQRDTRVVDGWRNGNLVIAAWKFPFFFPFPSFLFYFPLLFLPLESWFKKKKEGKTIVCIDLTGNVIIEAQIFSSGSL